MSLYNLRHDGDQYRVTKFDADLNPESSYLMTADECTCPAGVRPTCRHRQMFPALLTRIGSHWLYDFDLSIWVASTSEAAEPTNLLPIPDTELAVEDEEDEDDGDIPGTGEDPDWDARLQAVIDGEDPTPSTLLESLATKGEAEFYGQLTGKDPATYRGVTNGIPIFETPLPPPPSPTPFKRRF